MEFSLKVAMARSMFLPEVFWGSMAPVARSSLVRAGNACQVKYINPFSFSFIHLKKGVKRPVHVIGLEHFRPVS